MVAGTRGRELTSFASCRPPLQDVVDALSAKAMQEGALGLGTARYLDGAKSSATLPEGAQWRTIRVKFSRCASILKP